MFVIHYDVTPSKPLERFQGGKELLAKFDTDQVVSDFSKIFHFKQIPPSYSAAMMSSSVTAHRVYSQNASVLARNPNRKLGPFDTHTHTLGFIEEISLKDKK
jgi:hypothetical protein